jgi:galactitol-specific phosphotransferase system IIC component
MKDALVAAAMVLFAVVMSFFPSAWEPVSEAEARDLLEKEKL